MIPITIDLRGVFKEFKLTPKKSLDLAQKVKEFALLEVYRQWQNLASQELFTSRDEYQKSLQIVDKGRFEGSVILRGKFPNMVESGVDAFDMKRGFLKSEKAKISKEGKLYMSIPFRHGTPSSSGNIFKVMPTEVYEEVKKRGKLPQNSIPKPFDESQTRETTTPIINEKSQIFEEYTHKSSIFAGMQRVLKEYENTTQGKYITFRRVSPSSDNLAFIFPGLRPRKLADWAVEKANIPDLVDKVVDDYLYESGF